MFIGGGGERGRGHAMNDYRSCLPGGKTRIQQPRRAGAGPGGPPRRAGAGLTARGVLYIPIGWVAILVALGQTSRQTDQQGALQLLAGQPYGLVSLWLVGSGFA